MSSPANINASAPGTSTSKLSGYLSLFTSTGTMICCALPSMIAALAGGAALASFVSTFPWLVAISHYKEWIFLGAGLLILFTGILIYRPKGTVACSITGGEGCEIAGRFTKNMFWTSVVIYVVGAFFAFALIHIMRLTGWGF